MRPWPRASDERRAKSRGTRADNADTVGRGMELVPSAVPNGKIGDAHCAISRVPHRTEPADQQEGAEGKEESGVHGIDLNLASGLLTRPGFAVSRK